MHKQSYRAITGDMSYPRNYLKEFDIHHQMNGNFETAREYTSEEVKEIAKKLTKFHCVPVKLNKQWYCEAIKSWRLVFEYKGPKQKG